MIHRLLVALHIRHPGDHPTIRRSGSWPAFRRKHLAKRCGICGGKKRLNLHHKLPYHLHPGKELDPQNVVTLCEENSCHLAIGHLYNYRSYIPDVDRDIRRLRLAVVNRP
jgi:5-methylcytosine-specific restriction endonuclease McrA